MAEIKKLPIETQQTFKKVLQFCKTSKDAFDSLLEEFDDINFDDEE